MFNRMAGPISLKPIYQERVWGGRGLHEKLGRDLPKGKVIGESWDCVDRPEAQSVVVDGPHAGKTIRLLIEQHGSEIMGPDYHTSRPFPILVKWLDCKERLSLQVHPPGSVADELKGEPKTENWCIAQCDPDSHLVVGLKNGATREQFEAALKDNTLEDCVHRFPVQPGDSILVESGRIHAIDGGNLILEIQQNSDTTYRVYDWGRVGLDGKPRDMHIEESLKSIDFNDFEPSALRTAGQSLTVAEAKEFRIRKFELNAGESLPVDTSNEPMLLHVVSGTLKSGDFTSAPSSTTILPYGQTFNLAATEPSIVLITDRFI